MLVRSLAAAAFLIASAAHAQTWPTKPVRIVVNLPPGTSADLMARAFAPKTAEALGQPVLVENRPGATGNIAMELVAKSAPDGYTLLHSSGTTLAINPHLYKLNIDVGRDLQHIVPTMRTSIILVVRADSPIRTVNDLVARARANPGKLNFGSSGAGSGMHIATEMMMKNGGFKAVHVAYKGSAETLAALLGGQLDFTFDPGVALPHVKAGKVRLLGVARPTRMPYFPDAPTMAEAGTDANVDTVFGVHGPAKIPRDVSARLNREIGRAMQSPEATAALSSLAAELVTGTVEEFAAQQQRDRERYGAIVREVGIKAD